MADLISRLKLESGEFDSKIARATKGLLTMEKECRSVDGTLAILEKDQLEYVKSLGQMETVSQNAKGKIAELTSAFTELSVQYNRLTKEEKKGDYGRALASSLDQLKTRIKDSKSELSKVEGQLTSFGDVAKQMGAKLGIPVDQLTKVGPYGAAAAAALKVAGDAFKQNEVLMDEWGRTTEAAGTMYQGFLNALNTGDIGGFLRNIGNIISKAREAYDAMDELRTFNAFNQIQIEGARTDFTEAIANYREGSGTKEDVKAAAERLKNEMQTRQDKEQAAYIAAIKKLAASRGVDAEMLKKALSGTYGDYETLKATPLGERSKTYVDMDGNSFVGVERVAITAEQKMGEMLRKLNDDELAHIQSLGAQAQRTATEIAQVDKQTVRVLSANKGNNKAVKVPVEPALPEGSIAKLQDELKKANEKFNLAGTDKDRAAAKKSIDEITASIEKLQGKTKETAQEGSIAFMRQKLQELQKQWELAADPKTREDIKKQIGDISTALGEMEGKNKTATTALSMWGDHQSKIDETMNMLRQFQTMMDDPNIGEGQRKWAAEMAKSYEEQLKKMMGDTDTAVSTMNESLDSLSSGVGAISTLGNAFNDLKHIGEDLADAFSGEMEAWDALMTVFNSGIGIMETVISVIEAINTLTEIGAALKAKNAIAATTEASAVVAGKGTEAAATTSEMAVEATATGVTAGKAAASAGDAVAGIPIVGPVLAVAAVATVLAAILASVSKAKSSAGNYSMGGIVPGNSYSGDNLSIGVNSQELVLNRAQTINLASQLNSNPMGNLRLSTEISGTNLRIVMNNDNRSKGGDRNFYSKIH